MNPPEPLDPLLETCVVYAARYAHHRKTGAALLVVDSIIAHWNQLSGSVKETLVRESREATTNPEDWERLRQHHITHP